MTAIAEPSVDLDAIERDCERQDRRVARQQSGGLSLDALSDPGGACRADRR